MSFPSLEAAQSAILMMLQEDFRNKISCVLGIYSCQMFVNNCSMDSLYPKEENTEEEKNNTNVDDDDEEDVKLVRVPFLRNDWFDDHFDITEPKHLIGKTLYLLSRETDNTLSRSYQIIGLAMFHKWDKAAALLNTFADSKDCKAAQSAILMMLQEDFRNKISCVLGIYSCQMFVNNCSMDSLYPKEENTEEEKNNTNVDDDEEDVKLVRVPFLRNDWFDDHFDITEPKHLIGKTLYLLSRETDNTLSRSYQIIGLAMFHKWDKAAALLNTFADSKDCSLLNEAIEKTKALMDEIPEDEEKTKEKLLNKFNGLFEKMKSGGKIQDESLAALLESHLKDVLKNEKDDVDAQQKLFSQWESERKLAHDKQNVELDKERRLKVIEEKKEYLFWKEKLLFFFENEDENLEEVKKVKELVASLKGQTKTEDTYMPPEMIKKAPERLTKYKRLARVKKL
ncbi:28S ribosomal protein S27 [Trichonephila inaurata madagascariensis]|uniref:28S ribosomal protein S27 n=1 Tax=Trichonephila inaurata madagascariensis TaxID=2747483 RepID=A0A8X6Y794_9ARAC|nr:28S ribosomal protein S27 [Trichonephila inaurata madagascariensis]